MQSVHGCGIWNIDFWGCECSIKGLCGVVHNLVPMHFGFGNGCICHSVFLHDFV